MGCAGGKSEKPVKPKKTFTVLTLGLGGCGKTTFSKQLKIIYQPGGFNNEDHLHFKEILNQNLLLGLKEICFNLIDKEKVPKGADKVVEFFNEINAYEAHVDDKIAKKAKELWNIKGVKEILDDVDLPKNEYGESLKYVMANIDRVILHDFVPTNEDILHCRQRTVGTMETRVIIDKNEWVITDAGGQKTERRKWIVALQNQEKKLNVIIFFVALDDYDRPAEDGKGNAIEESLRIWDELMNGGQIDKNTAIILFLNKRDLFQEKLKQVPMKKYFKKYKGGDDYDKASQFIADLFTEKIQDEKKREKIFVEKTCAIDTENVKYVWGAAKEHVFMNTLEEFGLT